MKIDAILKQIPKLNVEDTRILISFAKMHLSGTKAEVKTVTEIEFINKYMPLIEKVNEELGINIRYNSRKREYTFPRYILSDYLLKKYIKVNSEKNCYKTIAKFFNQERTTIISSVYMHKLEMEMKQPYYMDIYSSIYNVIENFEKSIY